MVMVGAFLGGPGTTIPVGSGIMELQWVTSDGLNQTVSYQITGPETKTLQSDSNGYVAEMVTAGTYTVTPVHDGVYSGDDAKTVTVPNRSSVSATWFANRIYPQSVTINAGRAIPSCSYIIQNEKGEQVGEGAISSSSIVTSLYPGIYTITLSLYGCSTSKQFTVTSATTLDISSDFVQITVNSSILLTVKYNSVEVGKVSSFYVIKESNARIVSYVSPTYEGVSTSEVLSADSQSVTPSQDETVTPYLQGKTILITSSGNLTVPIGGTYSILCIGGGSNGVTAYAEGGGSGHVSYGDNDLEEGSRHYITIGSKNGGTSSFGSVRSASGASNTKDGGSGGGGGGGWAGGDATFGGGGGSGGTSGSITGGSGGTKGGDGGESVSAPAGRSGTSAARDKGCAQSNSAYRGGTGGSYASSTFMERRGSGGGGGYGAKGGNGGNSANRNYAGGGGGGGIAGGNGGKGGNDGVSSTFGESGSPGLGYGAGGGGKYTSTSRYGRGGGGGGGGYGSSAIATGTDGAKGCVVIKWLS